MKVLILRGIPGAGKSTFTRSLPGKVVVVSADNYFVDANGVYKFDPALIGEAHKWCQRQYSRLLRSGLPITIVVDNTNCDFLSMGVYMDLARAFDVPVEVHTFLVPPEVSFNRNVHNVPRNVIDGMDQKLRRSLILPGHWRSVPTSTHETA